jgi:hypothetical protein
MSTSTSWPPDRANWANISGSSLMKVRLLPRKRMFRDPVCVGASVGMTVGVAEGVGVRCGAHEVSRNSMTNEE